MIFLNNIIYITINFNHKCLQTLKEEYFHRFFVQLILNNDYRQYTEYLISSFFHTSLIVRRHLILKPFGSNETHIYNLSYYNRI